MLIVGGWRVPTRDRTESRVRAEHEGGFVSDLDQHSLTHRPRSGKSSPILFTSMGLGHRRELIDTRISPVKAPPGSVAAIHNELSRQLLRPQWHSGSARRISGKPRLLSDRCWGTRRVAWGIDVQEHLPRGALDAQKQELARRYKCQT